MRNERTKAGVAWFVVAVVIFLVGAAYVVVSLTTTSDLTDAYDDAPLLILGVAGVVSLAGWWRDRVRGSSADAEARREHERLESELREREEAHRVEKSWRQELHAEIMRMYGERGTLGDPSDVPSIVLSLSRTLLKAEKGLLLWRDEDGELALASAEGFEQDPEDSALARRFAAEVFESGQTIREDNPEVDGQRTEADEEIEHLVAIPVYLQDEFDGVVVCANNPDGFHDYDDEVLLSVGDQAGAVLRNAQLQGELRASYLATVSALADAIEVKDPFLRGHSEDVSSYVAAVADRLDLPPKRREELIFGSLLHDIGKIGISERILLKPDKLTPEEFEAIKLHPRIGYRLVQQVPALRPVAPAILHHHERFDGGGYPSGLQGEDIPLEARIICVADSFSAMISERPYRERMSIADACAELERCAGTQFDPEVVYLFVEEVRRDPPVFERQDLAAALQDPELDGLRREKDEPILGHGTVALIDNLTLLYTRRYFHEVAHTEARKAAAQDRPFGVVLVEVAQIDELNRRAGYAGGDRAIQAAARAVQAAATRHDGTACRYSGHRLGLLVPGAGEETATLLASEISADLKDGPDVHTATAAWRPDDTGDAVIKRARAQL